MDFDWGGIGSASMPSGSYCGELGTDRCAEITDANLTTFVQTVDISSLNILKICVRARCSYIFCYAMYIFLCIIEISD